MTTPASRDLRLTSVVSLVVLVGALGAARIYTHIVGPAAPDVDRAARSYVALVLALCARDPDSLDASALSDACNRSHVSMPFAEIGTRARSLAASLASNASAGARGQRLAAQLDAVATRADQLGGRRMPLAEELQRLFDIDEPSIASAEMVTSAEESLEALLPGEGSLAARLDAYQTALAIPANRLAVVFERALAECRARTLARVPLPATESIAVEYVNDRPWAGYSRYLGAVRSRIEVNADLPLTVDGALELACHEGYPGHHLQNILRDRARWRGLPEYRVLPIFSPEAFELEAAASLSGSLVFTENERIDFERRILFPLAGLDGAHAGTARTIARLRDDFSDTIASIVERYLSGRLDFVEAGWALQRDALMAHPIATLQFVNVYRGYALAYTAGRQRLDSLLGPQVPVDRRWANLVALIEDTP